MFIKCSPGVCGRMGCDAERFECRNVAEFAVLDRRKRLQSFRQLDQLPDTRFTFYGGPEKRMRRDLWSM
jgi:hypothetical protein